MADGGCGRTAKVSVRAIDDPRPARWNPPSDPRAAGLLPDECLWCGARAVHADARGITYACLACRRKITPPGVLAPYERGDGAGRQVKSQREVDRDALDLAGRKGLMLGQLRDLADGGRLDDAARLKVEWFAEQVKGAAGAPRLDDLAELFTEAKIRPQQHRWRQRPAELTAAYEYADDDEYDDDEYGGDDQGDEAAPVYEVAPAGGPFGLTWDGALEICGYRLSATVGGCQVVEPEGLCGAETAHHIGRGWICNHHREELAAVITATRNRAQKRIA